MTTSQHDLVAKLAPGATFATPFESGCVVIDAPDSDGNFLAWDSDQVQCWYSTEMVAAVTAPPPYDLTGPVWWAITYSYPTWDPHYRGQVGVRVYARTVREALELIRTGRADTGYRAVPDAQLVRAAISGRQS